MMELYLIRHGIAADRGKDWPDDSKRPLTPDGVARLRKARVALVGHEPNLGELAGQLIGARTPLEFKKGGICRIDFDMLPPKGGGMLRWFLTPKMLRKLGD